MVQVEDLVGLSSRISAFVHEAQRERGASSLFLAAKGAQFGPELTAQRVRTDAALSGLKEAVAAGGFAAMGGGGRPPRPRISRTSSTASRRAAQGDRRPVHPRAAGRRLLYGMIGAGLGLVRAMGGAMDEASIAAHAQSYAAFLMMKEAAGQERAAASAVFASGQYDLPAARRLATLTADQGTYAKLFRASASPAQAAALDAAEGSAPAREVARLRESLLALAPGELPPSATRRGRLVQARHAAHRRA